ncbi:MAG TPA: lytic transglycosylase domain-containing protein [Solirubrobacterales bacterium]|nr:lytic transglycosylase domain-containing protein [Solirubrobacterales bacterium]
MEAGSQSVPRAPKFLLGIPLGLLAALIALVLSIGLIFGASSNCGGGNAIGGLNSKVPSRLVPIYEQAASRYGLGAQGPSVLAAINKVETDFGRNMGPSSAGAIGWMQFEPSTWATYGVDANSDGSKNPNDPWDAIFAAARYLRASGAPGGWQAAILSYNHAAWYVAEVLADAKGFQGATTVQVAGFGDCAAAASGPAVQRMVAEAARIDALHLPYVWGGSHGFSPTPANGPFDCSSAVSHLLQVGGFRNPTMDTTELVRWGDPGLGRLVTIHVKPYGPEAHTFIEFMPGVTPPSERYWGTSESNPGGGPGWIPQGNFSAGYLAGFALRHPPGL